MENKLERFVRNPDFIFRKIVEETILVPVYQDVADMEAIYSLNELGAFLWEHLEEPLAKDELEEHILADFDVDQDTVKHDLAQFLQDMEEIGAVMKVKG